MNKFTDALQTNDALTWNGAISHSTSGNAILDYFAKCGSYRNRTQAEVDADMARIFGEDETLAMKVVLYNRMVTRKCKGFVDETEMQRGQGQKDEFIKSLNWIERNRPNLLKKNLWLVPEVGNWHDLFYHSPSTKVSNYVDTKLTYSLIKQGIENNYHRQLLAKYLPKIRSASNVTNDRHRKLNEWARGLCAYLGWTEREYRKFKSNPENVAHLWQRKMSNNDWKLNFNTIPGRALNKIVNGKVLSRHNLEGDYLKWIEKQPVAKFTGYPYELYQKAKGGRNLVKTHTFNKQFDGLIEKAKDGVNPELLKRGVLCALDTSGSMECGNSGVAPIDVCVGLGLFFSELLEGAFHNNVIMFDNHSRLLQLSGKFCDKVDQIKNSAIAWGGTNFQSVIDEIVRVRQSRPEIPVEEYPGVLLVVSDMQFNPTVGNTKTNYEAAMSKLEAVGLPKMTVIWWNVNGRFTDDVPSKMTDEGTVLISGFDGSIVSSLLYAEDVVDKKTGETRKANAYEQMIQALDQEILNCVKV